MHLKTSHTIHDIINHPAFEGFGPFILLLDRGRYDDDMPLEEVASLLPYHSNFDPEAAAITINNMIDLAASGETISMTFTPTSRRRRRTPQKNRPACSSFVESRTRPLP